MVICRPACRAVRIAGPALHPAAFAQHDAGSRDFLRSRDHGAGAESRFAIPSQKHSARCNHQANGDHEFPFERSHQ